MKGPYYEAFPVRSWPEFLWARKMLTATWGAIEGFFLQSHVDGCHESIAFAAYSGLLLDAVGMQKTARTELGKTWSGRIMALSEEKRHCLAKVVEELMWTGGAEIECIRDDNGKLWLMEWNPRFPAWIYGAAIAGHNLPGNLVSKATGYPIEDLHSVDSVETEFTRVVIEVPKRRGDKVTTRLGLSESANPSLQYNGGQHPSGMPTLSRILAERTPIEPCVAN